MPLNRPSLNTIVERIEKSIESRLFGNVALLRRAIARILARVFGGAIHTNYGSVEWLQDQLFVTTCEEEFLTRHGKAWGVNRRSGSFATGEVEFSGSDGVVIEEDTRIQDANGIEYGTLTEETISGGVVTIEIQAVEVGDDANKTLGVDSPYLQLIEAIEFVDSQVEITSEITGGVDQEDIEVWRERILFRIQNPPMGGNTADYIAWATEVNGVGRAWSYPAAFGLGTVGVAITSSDESNPVPTQQLLNDVTAYISTRQPVTADVSVVSITDTNDDPGTAEINIGMDITPNNSQVRNAITQNIEDLLAPHKPGTNVKISQLRSAISGAGVDDFNIWEILVDVTQLQTDEDLVFTGFQWPQLNNITFQDL